MENRITTICDCLSLLGCGSPFVIRDNIATAMLTPEGNNTYRRLRELLIFFEKYGVVEKFNEDKLDLLVNEEGY